MNSVLAAEKLKKSFPSPRGPIDVIHEANVIIREGDFVMLTGPSGSGKTTFLNIAALMEAPTEGNLSFDGRPVSGLNDKSLCYLRAHKIGMIYQRFHLLPHRTALDNVIFRFRYLHDAPADIRDLSIKALESLGMRSAMNTPGRLLSAGEMQRTAIARATVVKPRLLVADEPTGNLDSASAETVMETLKELNRSGITILMATHNQELLKYASRRIECRDGNIE